MAKQTWVVRVADPMLKAYEDGVSVPQQHELRCSWLSEFLEQLRYAHLVHVFKGGYDLMPPKAIADTALWAKMNAERMRSFGYNAVPAPAQSKPEEVR